MDVLLLSSSRTPGQGYLEHALSPIGDILGTGRRACFVPFAGVTVDWDEYTERVRSALAPLGVVIEPLHRDGRVEAADAILVGGGNTFHLLRECRRRGLLETMRRRVRDGVPYLGWSAGANLACPTICTTNDMPIVDPGGFDALGLVPFQINPHFTDELPAGHQGERRSDRIVEMLQANPGVDVLAMPEGTWVRVASGGATFGGAQSGLWFRAGSAPTPVATGPLPAALAAPVR